MYVSVQLGYGTFHCYVGYFKRYDHWQESESSINGRQWQGSENMSDGYDRYIFQLAGAFLTSQDFQMPYVPIAKEGQHIIQRALEAAEVIETVFNAE